MPIENTNYPVEEIDLALMNRVLRHRLRNLCAGVKMTAARISETTKETHPRMSSRCEVIISELDNLNEFTNRLDYLFDNLPPSSSLSLFELVSELRESFSTKFPFCNLELNGIEAAISLYSGNLIKFCLKELLSNAGDAASNNGSVSLSWKITDVFEISVSNTGPNIPENIPINPPQPFNTDKSRHDGIGLPIAYRICNQLNCKLLIDNTNENIVTVKIQLPPEEFTNEQI